MQPLRTLATYVSPASGQPTRALAWGRARHLQAALSAAKPCEGRCAPGLTKIVSCAMSRFANRPGRNCAREAGSSRERSTGSNARLLRVRVIALPARAPSFPSRAPDARACVHVCNPSSSSRPSACTPGPEMGPDNCRKAAFRDPRALPRSWAACFAALIADNLYAMQAMFSAWAMTRPGVHASTGEQTCEMTVEARHYLSQRTRSAQRGPAPARVRSW